MELNYIELDSLFRNKEKEIDSFKIKMESNIKQMALNNKSNNNKFDEEMRGIYEENLLLKNTLKEKESEIQNYLNKIAGLKIEFETNIESAYRVKIKQELFNYNTTLYT